MEKIYVTGEAKISGVIDIQGAKNSVLPILAATILNKGISVIHNCPNLSDVNSAVEILEYLGCKIKRENKTIIVDATVINKDTIPDNLMRKMRSSVMFLGPIIARMGSANLTFPGGCELGPRPIDLHIEALEHLGATFDIKGSKLKAKVNKLYGTDIHLSFPSVGATENAIMAATKAYGKTRIINAAREPEIIDLQNFLLKLGAKISGAGGSVIEIEGGLTHGNIEHTVIADRIVASTYLAAAAMTGGEVLLKGVNHSHFMSVTEILKSAGCDILAYDDNVYLKTNGRRIKAVNPIKTMPYPGFPTDAQAIIMSAFSVSEGTTVFYENIFESRYRHVNELLNMGADIKVFGKACVVTGKQKLVASKVTAPDLRGGAALVLAGLVAEGITEVSEISHIIRGYDSIDSVLSSLGANVYIK